MSIEIITRKLSRHLRVNPDAILMGDLRTQMARDLLKSLTQVIEQKANRKEPYFILVHTKTDPASMIGPGVIKERLILLDQMPQRYLGTLLFRVDNKNADAELVWNLPLDTVSPSLIQTERPRMSSMEGVTSIMESVQGIPINRRVH